MTFASASEEYAEAFERKVWRKQGQTEEFHIWWTEKRMSLRRCTPTRHNIKTTNLNNIDHLITMWCSAGKPWVLAFMWMPLDTHHPSKHCCGLSTTPHHNNTIWWQWPPSRTMCPDTLHTLLRNSSRNIIKCPRCWPGLQIPHGGLTLQHTGPRGSTIKRPGARLCRPPSEDLSPCLDRSELF